MGVLHENTRKPKFLAEAPITYALAPADASRGHVANNCKVRLAAIPLAGLQTKSATTVSVF